MTNKEKYILYCESQPDIPIYMRDWWLDCNCGPNHWDVLLYEKDGVIESFMTYYLPYEGSISMPIYSKAMGIWFDPSIKKERYTSEIARKHAICKYFIEKLPPFESYLQNFHHSFTDWLPFYWEGFEQTTRYNYIIPDISDPDKLWAQYKKVKRDFTKAQSKKLYIKKSIPIDDFLAVNAMSFDRRKMEVPQEDILKKLIQVSQERNQGDIWGVYDDNKNLHAVSFAVWQESGVYGIAAGRDQRFNSTAHVFMTWEMIKYFSPTVKSFDFQGSMIPGVEFINREFGAIQYPYFVISKGKRGITGTFNAIKSKLLKR